MKHPEPAFFSHMSDTARTVLLSPSRARHRVVCPLEGKQGAKRLKKKRAAAPPLFAPAWYCPSQLMDTMKPVDVNRAAQSAGPLFPATRIGDDTP